jgi:hypothetical protein
MKNITPSIRVAFVLEGSYTVDQQGVFSTEAGREGFTLVRKPGSKPKAVHFSSLKALVQELDLKTFCLLPLPHSVPAAAWRD